MAAKKQAKVYDAGESPEQIKPAVTRTSHKECSPGEFGAMVAKATEKSANSMPSILERTYLQGSPTDLAGTWGATGAGLGAIIGALRAEKGKRLRGAVRGLAVGGLGGAMAGMGAGTGLDIKKTEKDYFGDEMSTEYGRALDAGAGGLAAAGGLAGGMLGNYVADKGDEAADEAEKANKKKEKTAAEFGAMLAKLAMGPGTGTLPRRPAARPNAQDSAVRLAQQNNINLANVRGSGAGGMVMGSDIRRMTSGQPAPQGRVSPQTAQATNAAAGSPAVQPSGATPEWQSLPPAELDARISATRQRLGIDPTGGPTSAPAPVPTSAPAPVSTPATAPTPARTGPINAQGSAQRLAKQHGIDLNTIQGSGENGMIMGSDIRRAIMEKGGSAYAFGAMLGDMHIKTANKGLMNLLRRGVGAVSGAAKPTAKAMPAVPVPPPAVAKPTDAELFAQLGEVFKSKAPPVVSAPVPAPRGRAGTAAPEWVRNTQRIQRGLDPATGVRPGAVAPAPAPLRSPPPGARGSGLAREQAVPPTKVTPPAPTAPAAAAGGQPGLVRENAVRRTGALMGQPAVPAVPGPSGVAGVAERLTPRDNQFGRAMDLLRAGGLAAIP